VGAAGGGAPPAPAHCRVGQAACAALLANGEAPEPAGGGDEPQVEVLGRLVVPDADTGPVLTAGMGERCGECGVVGQVVGVDFEHDVVGEADVLFGVFGGAAHRDEPADDG
jgi:hypothetical protein